MDIKEFVKKLDNRQYGHPQFTKEELESAKNHGFVIIYGASDDLMEIDGAISDEADCYDGGIVRLNTEGVCYDESNEKYIEALWCQNADGTKSDISWQYNTEIPHETFIIYEGDEKYCQGIVFDIAELRREDLEEITQLAYKRHKEFVDEWQEGEPVEAWKEEGCEICVKYESGKWWHYKDLELPFPTWW